MYNYVALGLALPVCMFIGNATLIACWFGWLFIHIPIWWCNNNFAKK